MNLFVAIAYRWGYSDNHSYLVVASQDYAKVNDAAIEENLLRGGKYGVTIYEIEDGKPIHEQIGDTLLNYEPKIVNHFSSCYGEKEPRQGWRTK